MKNMNEQTFQHGAATMALSERERQEREIVFGKDFEAQPIAVKYPDNNPKAAVGAKKLPVHYVPPALMLGAAEAMADGAKKYGPYNFRESQIAAGVYMGAMLRHLFTWWDGEDIAQDSGVHHIKHVAACAGLILDAMECGTFADDRPAKSGAAKMRGDWNDNNTDTTS